MLFPKALPAINNLRPARTDELYAEGLTIGTLVVGRQGSGKTSYLAKHLFENFKKYPRRAVFVLDWSGSITSMLLTLVLQQDWEEKERDLRRIVYDELGNSEWVIPMPEFSPAYGSTYEEQIERVRENWRKLAEYLIKNTAILGGVAINGIAPKVFKLLTCIGENDHWQITEFGRLIDNPSLMSKLIGLYGARIPERVKETLLKRLINVKAFEEELRTYSFTELTTPIESPASYPRLGYYRPGWTPREAIDKGLLVVINGQNLINQKNAQHYLFTQVYSLIMAEINKRSPADPDDEPVSIVMDEVYSLLSVPGMAEEVGMISPIYRSRKVQLYVVIQALWQLAGILREQIWSLGNIVSFGINNYNEAEEIAKQLFNYNPIMVKQDAKTETQNPTTEPYTGQYSMHANWLQNLEDRECVIRRYQSEKVKDPYIRYIVRTSDLPKAAFSEPLHAVKERLLKERGVRIRDALEVINQRALSRTPPKI